MWLHNLFYRKGILTGEIKSDILYTKENNVYIKAKGRRKMKLGFIGAGNMAKAMMGGILKNGILTAEEVIASDMYVPGLEKTKEELMSQRTIRKWQQKQKS